MTYLFIAALAYGIGSISFAVVVSAAMRLQDPRSYGSKNPGATNVLRSGNTLAAVLTLIGDALKGWLAVWLTAQFVHSFGSQYEVGNEAIGLAALAVFLGHLWPIFFHFKGGKGVATAAGVLFAIHPILGLATAASWLIIAFFFRYSSLAALVAAIFAPLYEILMFGFDSNSIAVLAMSLLLISRHRSNIQNLFAGKEGRLGQKSKDKSL
ncbi:MAG: glycerol-3-phosphate acyltransferase PlsY [Glomeribacter sp. 1016415]|uniref:Glycerol-3-phosphate acyltransferase n=1 Tax=Mycoavidus cysteinexigens TaxID=1553431 RepID=A0A2Z6EY01_9BURK|nr:glycerol-3-phosphate 1-O-acyltransferase PlsY [Mycoavidus cysteinexigens]MCX8566254.1 glycerol-3-phosphate acyltransferase PlsY [Glomeribacter sp. 1016415]BBE10321.1 glycerol-3-phosphate acyltransferase PlsY [Mycoavidus cysteinexigens]GAM53307.1 glycerol-3-phosphate O-acyltransferase PlsY [bacterium endosymbiont of Mortierella elongata FMR23-6]GLR00738.1 glycerol-3-phosphate acyltransferase [Mycoavidus cysteinexigens]